MSATKIGVHTKAIRKRFRRIRGKFGISVLQRSLGIVKLMRIINHAERITALRAGIPTQEEEMEVIEEAIAREAEEFGTLTGCPSHREEAANDEEMEEVEETVASGDGAPPEPCSSTGQMEEKEKKEKKGEKKRLSPAEVLAKISHLMNNPRPITRGRVSTTATEEPKNEEPGQVQADLKPEKSEVEEKNGEEIPTEAEKTEEAAMEEPGEAPKEAAVEESGEAPKEATVEESGEAPKEAVMEESVEAPEGAVKEGSGEAPEKATEEAIEEAVEKADEEANEKAAEETIEDAAEEAIEDAAEENVMISAEEVVEVAEGAAPQDQGGNSDDAKMPVMKGQGVKFVKLSETAEEFGLCKNQLMSIASKMQRKYRKSQRDLCNSCRTETSNEAVYSTIRCGKDGKQYNMRMYLVDLGNWARDGPDMLDKYLN